MTGITSDSRSIISDVGPRASGWKEQDWGAAIVPLNEDALLVHQALSAIEHTAPGNHVNLVTHAGHGRPADSLYDALESAVRDGVEWESLEQCGCGGHVARVYVE